MSSLTLGDGFWEDGYDKGFKFAIKILQIAKKLEDHGCDPEKVLQSKLNEFEDNNGNQ